VKDPVWVLDEVVRAIHAMLIAEHGGGNGIRDSALLDSALARSKQKLAYATTSSIFELAAAYSVGIAKNHPFIDGNKPTAFTIGALFLELNGFILDVPETDAAITFEHLASGKINEKELARWFQENCTTAA